MKRRSLDADMWLKLVAFQSYAHWMPGYLTPSPESGRKVVLIS
ncbi:hypothetical protein OKW41_003966 [Paraburkholderia sp. UCT70]